MTMIIIMNSVPGAEAEVARRLSSGAVIITIIIIIIIMTMFILMMMIMIMIMIISIIVIISSSTSSSTITLHCHIIMLLFYITLPYIIWSCNSIIRSRVIDKSNAIKQ